MTIAIATRAAGRRVTRREPGAASHVDLCNALNA
jgi:hypothetical protein